MDRLFQGGSHWPVALVLLIGLGVGVAIGFINGAMISKLKIPPFIATLVMTFARGWLSSTPRPPARVPYRLVPGNRAGLDPRHPEPGHHSAGVRCHRAGIT